MSIVQSLFPGLQALDSDGNAVSLTGGFRPFGKITLLPRAHYEMSRRTIARGDAKGIQSARAQAEFESEYEDPQILVEVQQAGRDATLATVWTWDRSQSHAANARLLPEPLARVPMRGDGARLVKALQGYDGEVWDNGYCVASRWWAAHPSDADWRDFQVGARSRYWPRDLNGDVKDFPKPDAEDPEWVNNRIWVSNTWQDRISSIRPVQVAMISAVVLAAPFSFNAFELVKSHNDIAKYEEQLEVRKAEAAPWLADQRRALSVLNQIRNMISVGEPEAIVFALMDLEAELDKYGIVASQINYEAPQLQVRFEGTADSQSNTVDLVQSLESSVNWSGVRYDSALNAITGSVVSDLNSRGAQP